MGSGLITLPLPPGLIPAVKEVTIAVSPAQFLNVDNTTANAVQIIPAQGPGTLILIEYLDINIQFPTAGGVAYATGTGNVVFTYQDLSVAIVNNGVTSASVKTAVSLFFRNTPANPFNSSPLSSSVNQAVVMSLANATKYTSGNSWFLITVRYKVANVL
jgi:hypothetical protein